MSYMYIRMKVRTLVLVLCACVLLIVLAVFEVPLLLMRAHRYDAVIRYFPYSSQMNEALWKEAQVEGPHLGQMSYIYIFPGNDVYTSGSFVPEGNPVLAAQYLTRLLKRDPDGPHTSWARWELAQADQQIGNLSEAVVLYRKFANTPGSRHQTDAQTQLASLGLNSSVGTGLHTRSRADGRAAGGAGTDGTGSNTTQGKSPSPTQMVTGRITIGGKPLVNAFVFLRSTSQENEFMMPPSGLYPGAYTNQQGFYRINGVSNGSYQVGIGVTLPQVAGYYLPYPKGSVVQVKDGNAATLNLNFIPQIEVVSPAGGTTIHGDKLTFTWRPYPGASYYRVILYAFDGSKVSQSYMEFDLPGTYSGTAATFSIQKLRGLFAGGGSKDSVHGLLQTSILGALHPAGAYSWAVDAYNSVGKRISSSRGYYVGPGASAIGGGSAAGVRAGAVGVGISSPSSQGRSGSSGTRQVPIFYTSTKGELAGDKYVLKYQYTKAKQAYLKAGDNPYALRALGIMALYGTGWKDKGNPQEALKYFDRIKNPSPGVQKLIAQAKKDLSK